MRRSVAFLVLMPALVAQAPAQPNPAGDWHGILKVGAVNLRLALHLTAQPDGSLTGTMDSLDQGAKGMKIEAIQWKGTALSFRLVGVNASYEGTLDTASQRIEGIFTQGGPLPLTFTRGEAKPLLRPQQPRPPFPYAATEVRFPGGAAGVELAGTLTVPAGKGPFPAVVLVHGSGPHDRDETIFGHKPFAVLADHLSRQGIAVLRFDKRGLKGSTGSHALATTADFAADAEAALAFLTKQPGLDPKRLGIIGHSEGGVIAPMVAARSRVPAFLVLMAGTAAPGEDVILAQSEALARAAGAAPEVLVLQRQQQEKMFQLLKAHPEATPEAFRDLLAAGFSPEARKAGEAALLQQAHQVANPWFRAFLTLDPRLALKQVKVPVLALFGEKDLQVVPGQNRPEMEKALKGNRNAVIRTLPGLNHLFQPARTGAVSEYGEIETTLEPGFLADLTRWIQERRPL